jgi:hypothetical protein
MASYIDCARAKCRRARSSRPARRWPSASSAWQWAASGPHLTPLGHREGLLALEDFMAIRVLAKQGVHLCDIAEQLGMHPRTVRRAFFEPSGCLPGATRITPGVDETDRWSAAEHHAVVVSPPAGLFQELRPQSRDAVFTTSDQRNNSVESKILQPITKLVIELCEVLRRHV